MSSTAVSGKRKRVSKNKKKNWRKHSDIKDVEEFMDDQRMQERTGGIVADKPNEELFVVEKRVDLAEPAQKKRKRGEKPLRCHSMLKPDPRVRPVRLVEHVKKPSVKKRHPAVREKIENGVIPQSEKIAHQQRKAVRKQKNQQFRDKKKAWSAQYDMWDAENNKEVEVDEHYMKVTKKMKVRAPNSYLKKPSGVASVEVAQPGASYNPTYDDHQKLLQKALVVEMDRDKEEKRIERALDAKFPTTGEAPTVHSWLQEMGTGLFDEDEESEDNSDSDVGETGEDEGDEDRLSVNPPVRREEKKTLKQRRKERERREKEEAILKEKALKVRKNELFRLKAIRKNVKEREADLKKRDQQKAELKEANKDKTKKLGKMRFEAPSLEIKLSDELEGSLRLLKPEGHLLDDRFKSLQKRNIIEPRLRTKVVKKYKRKKFEKKTHKEVSV